MYKNCLTLIKRFTNNITVLYDGDTAGIKASFRGIDLILKEGMNVKVISFPQGEDPDSFAQKNTTTELEEFVEKNAQDFIKIFYFQKQHQIFGHRQKQHFLRELVRLILIKTLY